MRNIRLIVAAVLLALVASGCIVHVNDDAGDGDTSWRERERDNREAIERLTLGAGVGEVRASLGAADFSEAFSRAGHDYRILFYRTHRVEGDGETSRDETTPLVFRDGELIGWGGKAYRNLPER